MTQPPASGPAPAIVCISSHVARGAVGNRSTVFALESFGFPVWSVPTVLLPFHPGHGRATRIEPDPNQFANFLADLSNAKWTGEIGAVMTGYMANARQASEVADFISALRRKVPNLLYLCDPVIGDHGGLYVAQETAAAIRDLLLPLADIATPNRHELAWLAGTPPLETARDAIAAARRLGPARVVVTSTTAFMRGNIANLLVGADGAWMAEHRLVDGPANGGGDMFAALFLANLLQGMGGPDALARATAAIHEAIARAAARGSDELMPPADRASLMRPAARVELRNLAEPLRPASPGGPTLVGVDGCSAGWIAVLRSPGSAPRARIFPDFAAVLAAAGPDAFIAVDMPIGLPDRVGAGGRGAEREVRPMLGARQSSVFSIPSRAAVYEMDYREACAIALATSDPPRKISKQGFMLFPRIREIDSLIDAAMQARIRESHPELAFTVLNGGAPMATPKKIKGRINPQGMAERRALLQQHGFSAGFLGSPVPRGAAVDDFLDACVCCLIAGRIASGEARSYPADPPTDSRGLHVAMWA